MRKSFVTLFVVWSLILIGCSSAVNISSVSTPENRIETILFVGFENMTDFYGIYENVISPLSGSVFVTGPVEDGATAFLTDSMTELLKKELNVRILPPDSAKGVLVPFSAGQNERNDELNRLQKAGRRVNADIVIIGRIYRYIERIGTAYSVESPASVTFDLDAVSTHSDRVVWSGQFSEIQKPLSENLFALKTFISRGGKWITAKHMATGAADEMVNKLGKYLDKAAVGTY